MKPTTYRKAIKRLELSQVRASELVGRDGRAAFVLVLQPFAIVLLWAANHSTADQQEKTKAPAGRPVAKPVARKPVGKAKRKVVAKPKLIANDNVLRFPRPAGGAGNRPGLASPGRGHRMR